MSRPVSFMTFLVDKGLLSRDEAKEIEDVAHRSRQLLGQMLLRKRLLTFKQMVTLLDEQANQPGTRLGELAIRAGFITQDQLSELLGQQPGEAEQHPLDQLVVSGRLSHSALVEALIAYVKLYDEAAETAAI